MQTKILELKIAFVVSRRRDENSLCHRSV